MQTLPVFQIAPNAPKAATLRRLTASCLLLLALPCITATASAYQPDQESQNLTDDIRFARDLARWRYFDLAVEWLAQIENQASLDSSHKSEVILEKAHIARMASEHALTRDARKKFYDEAIEHYEAAIKAMTGGMSLVKGKAIVDGLADVLVKKGQFYGEELDLLRKEGAPADQLTPLRTIAEESFKAAVKALNEAYGELDSRSEDSDLIEDERAQLRELALFSLFRKGESYYSWAQLYEPQDFNREDYLTKCVESLIDFIWEAGDENTFFTWYAYYYQGMAEFDLGKIPVGDPVERDEKALSALVFIYSDLGIAPQSAADEVEEESTRNVIIGLFERAYDGTAQIYLNAADRYEAAADVSEDDDLARAASAYMVVGKGNSNGNGDSWKVTPPVSKTALVTALRSAAVASVQQMGDRLAAAGLPVGPYGYLAKLEKARALSALGRGGEALEIVKSVAENNSGNVVGLDAQGLLANLLGEVDSGEQPPGVLRLAADGFLAEERHLEAIETLQQVIAACRSAEQKNEFVAACWLTIGQVYAALGRNLEAALAFENGIDAARQFADEEATGDLANRAYGAWNRRFVETKHDFDREQRDRVRQLVIELGVGADLTYFVAKEAFSDASATENPAERKAAFESTVGEFDKVPTESVYHERALVYKARCQAEAGKNDQAIATFDALFERVSDPKQRVGVDRKKQQQRDIAHAEGTFYKAGVLNDAKQFAQVLATLENYESKFPDQSAFYPSVDYYRVLAYAGLGDLKGSEKVLGRMVATYPDDRSTTYAFNAIAGGHFAAFQAQADNASDEARASLRAAADNLAEYNKRTGYGSFQNLRNVGDWYKELGDWKSAEAQYQRLYEKYGTNPAYQKDLQDAQRDLAEVLQEQMKFQDAEILWREVFARKGRDRAVVRNFARCLGGWLEESENRGIYEYQEVTGVAKYPDAMDLWLKLKKGIEDAGDKGSSDWWETQVTYLYCLYMEAATNKQLKESGERLIKNWRSLSGASLDQHQNREWKRRLDKLDRALQGR